MARIAQLIAPWRVKASACAEDATSARISFEAMTFDGRRARYVQQGVAATLGLGVAMRLFSSAFGHRRLAVFVLLAGVSLMSSSCKILGVPPKIQCEPGSKTFTAAGNSTNLNVFRVPGECKQVRIYATGPGGGGGGGYNSTGHEDNTGEGGGGGGSGLCHATQFTIVSSIFTSGSTIAAYSLIIVDVGVGGSGGRGQGTQDDSLAAPKGGTGIRTTVRNPGNIVYAVALGGNGGAGGQTSTGGAGGEGGGQCSQSGSSASGPGGGRGGTGVGTSDFVFGDGGAGGEDPGCNKQGKRGSDGAAPGGGGGGGSGGRTCGLFGGRHSGGSGGNGGNGLATIYWE